MVKFYFHLTMWILCTRPNPALAKIVGKALYVIVCAVLRTQKPFKPNYVSINPVLLKKA